MFDVLSSLPLSPSTIVPHVFRIVVSSFLINRDSRDELLHGNINNKISTWALWNITSLTHKCLDELFILRNEGYVSLPKSSNTLLHTNRTETKMRPILSTNGTYGLFSYFNIKNTLEKITSPDIYSTEDISLLINIDGASIHQKSKKHIWTILGVVYHHEYDAKPFLIGLYYGESKPNSPNEFLDDFINEVNDMITNGINIGNSHYSFNIKTFVCDTPARAAKDTVVLCVRALRNKRKNGTRRKSL